MNTDDRPYATAAFDYLHAGLGMPVPLNGKILIPAGATGGDATVTAADIDRWTERYPSSNIGLVLDPTVVAIDVDHGYTGHDGRIKHGADTLHAFEATLGTLPATITSTSRHGIHPESRIRFYRVTESEGASLRGNIDLRLDGQGPGDVEIIHHHYRYTAVWPAIHPDTGETYRWYTADGLALDRVPSADELPDLPARWVSHLLSRSEAKAAASYGVATPTEIAALLTDGEPHPDLAAIAVRFWTEQIGHGSGREDESDLLGMTKVLARLIVAAKLAGSRKAVEIARKGYLRDPYGTETYARAFDAALAGSIRFWTRYEEEYALLRGAVFGPPDNETETVTTTPQAPPQTPSTATEKQAVTETPQPVTPAMETEAEALYRKKVEEARIALRIRREAERLETEATAGEVTFPRVVSLTDFLDEPDDDPQWRMEGLWPTGGNVMLAAAQKSGKSVMVGNVIRSLADGDNFLGRFQTETAQKVVVIDDELDPRMWRRWLRQQGIRETGGVHLVSLKGNVASFNIVNPAVRAVWADMIRDADVLIFDCLRPVLDALGLSEDHEAGRFLVAFDALKKEAGISDGLLVHHMGHGGKRARGDSALPAWPEANWKIHREDVDDEDDPEATDGDDVREFEAEGRDVLVRRAALVFDPETKHLTLADGSRKAGRVGVVLAAVLDAIRRSDGPTVGMLEAQLGSEGHSRGKVREAIKMGLKRGQIRTEVVAHNTRRHYLAGPFGE